MGILATSVKILYGKPQSILVDGSSFPFDGTADAERIACSTSILAAGLAPIISDFLSVLSNITHAFQRTEAPARVAGHPLR